MGIHSITIENYKSIRKVDELEIHSINILIGSNGVGKSNFISFFKLLNKIYIQQLQLYVSQNGRADNFLHFGRKLSDNLSGTITFNNEWKNEYSFTLVPDQGDNLIFSGEYSNYTRPDTGNKNKSLLSNGGNLESVLKIDNGWRNNHLREQFLSFKIFHFHDTGFNSKVKNPSRTQDNKTLQEDAGNLAAFLYILQETKPKYFSLIEKVINSIAPFFGNFFLEPDEKNPEQIFLRWQEKGSEQLFTAHNLSDGTLRMICLTTLLMQPDLPDTIIIDEPELGLHPFAISKLAGMLKIASVNSQIIISTQSVNLVNQFSANNIIVVDRVGNQSVFERQSEDSLKTWLEEYSIGELWEKNVIGGRL